MGSKHIKRRVLNYEKPWVRKNPKPPKARTLLGASFSAANFQGVLTLQHCQQCNEINYPPRELCKRCLSDHMVWAETNPEGVILSLSELFHSQWEFFKRKIERAPWPIVTVEVAGQVMFAHLAAHTFTNIDPNIPLAQALPSGTAIEVFTATDSTYQSVIIAVSKGTEINTVAARIAIVNELGLREVG